MASDDILWLSLGVNIGLLAWNHRLMAHNKLLAEVASVFGMAIQDASKGNIKFVRKNGAVTLEKVDNTEKPNGN
jgi:hypothetical protein